LAQIREEQVQMRYFRTIAVAAAILAVAGCSKSNPLIGKWKLAPNAGNECFQLAQIEFTPTTMTMATPLAPVTSTVTYTSSGDTYTAALPDGMALQFQTESGGLKSLQPECHLVPAS
jgi:hypothetical protein